MPSKFNEYEHSVFPTIIRLLYLLFNIILLALIIGTEDDCIYMIIVCMNIISISLFLNDFDDDKETIIFCIKKRKRLKKKLNHLEKAKKFYYMHFIN